MRIRSTLAADAGALDSLPTSAAALEVLSAGAIETGILSAADHYLKETGTVVRLRFATAPTILKLMAEGAKVDLVIAPPAVLDELARTGKVDSGTRSPIGKVGVGVASRAGGPTPDVSSAEAFKKSALSADSLAFNTASTGLYIDRLFEKLGMTEAVQAKAKRYGSGEAVMEHLINGAGQEFGFGAATEIARFKDRGLRLIGPLPAEIQNFTSYAASTHSSATNNKDAADFLLFLASPATKKRFADKGVEQ